MDIYSLINQNFKPTYYLFEERSMIVEVKIETKIENLPNVDNLKLLLSNISQRDKYKISFSSITDDFIEISSEQFNLDNYVNFVSELTNYSDVINIEIEINKCIMNSTLSIYNYESFSENIIKKKTIEILKTFNNFLKNSEYIIFEIFDSNVTFSTTTMLFSGRNNTAEITPKFSRSKRIDIYKSVCNFYNIKDIAVVPEDFDIVVNCKDNKWFNIFNCLKSMLSTIYISSNATINDELLNIQIIGQRVAEYHYKLDDDIIYNEELYKIYKWTYTDGNVADKIVITRNILSLHCKFSDLFKIDEKTFASIQSNFNIYLKNNVVQYLDLKNKVSESVQQSVQQSGDTIIELINKFKNNIFAILSFIFTVVIINVVSDTPLNNIFTKDITAILMIVFVCSIGFLLIGYLESMYKLKTIMRSYNSLKDSYADILDDFDLKEILKNDLDIQKQIKKARNTIRLFSIIWLVVIFIFIIFLEYNSDEPVLRPIISGWVDCITGCIDNIKTPK